MKKIDYSILATLIACESARYFKARDIAPSAIDFARADGAFKALEWLAHSFANRAHVDRALFIRECE